MSDKTEKKSGAKPKVKQEPDPVLDELKELARIVMPCLQCATCASSCPVFQSDSSKNPRRIVYRLCRDEYDGILDEVDFWWCGGCYSCEAHCPQDVPLTRVLFRLKNLAFMTGRSVPKQILRIGEALHTGFVFPLKEEIKAKRDRMGLPDLVKPNVEEIGSLLAATQLADLLKKSKTFDDGE